MNKLTRLPTLAPDVFAALPMEPLRITARLVESVATYEAIHMDGLLAYAVVERHCGPLLDPQYGPYDIPLPLARAWCSESGAPLWCATDLAPNSGIHDKHYIHKRSLETHMTTANLRLTQGQHKEMRRPLPTVYADLWQADCIGHAETIALYLKTIQYIGKKRAIGLGCVAEWQIDPIPKFSFYDEAGNPRRPIPTAVHPRSFANAYRGGWTPPYWLSDLWEDIVTNG